MNFPEQLIHAIQSAQHIAILTGAGISAESGVPTFREAQTGLWAQYDPQALATRHAFRQNPRLVWEWYAWRRELVAQARPNPGHRALVELAQRVPRLTLVTQNVDGLHQQAGSQNVVELHGNINRIKCFDQNHPVAAWEETGEAPPRCPVCGSYLRPDVVWFGESLPAEALHTAVTAAESCDIFFTIGTSAVVEPAASLPVAALRRQIPVVEINPETTPLTAQCDYALAGPAGEILPALLAALRS